VPALGGPQDEIDEAGNRQIPYGRRLFQPDAGRCTAAHKHSLIRFHVCSSRKDELSLEISPVACIMGEPDFAAEINREIIS